MPLSLQIAETRLKVPVPVSRFVIPLGTTINMGGTALYQAVAALFLAQVFGVSIGVMGMVLLASWRSVRRLARPARRAWGS